VHPFDFLSAPENQSAFRSAGSNLARAVSDYTFAKRLTLAGTFVEQLAVLWSIRVDLAKVDACHVPSQAMFARAKSGAPDKWRRNEAHDHVRPYVPVTSVRNERTRYLLDPERRTHRSRRAPGTTAGSPIRLSAGRLAEVLHQKR
jgi:hypothetical protein